MWVDGFVAKSALQTVWWLSQLDFSKFEFQGHKVPRRLVLESQRRGSTCFSLVVVTLALMFRV